MKTTRLEKCACYGNSYEILTQKFLGDKILPLSVEIVRCPKCGLIRTFPIPKETITSEREINKRFDNLSLWEIFAIKTINFIKVYKKKNNLKILDIGANIGVLVKVAKEAGWDAEGIDIDPRVVKLAKEKLGVDIRLTDLEKAKFKDNQFDVCTLSHTLEHVYKPNSLLIEIWRILKSDGILYIEVPNIMGFPVLIQKLRGKRWYGLDPDHHVWHFTSESIKQLLEINKFTIIELSKKNPLHYEHTGALIDYLRDFILWISGKMNAADQIIVVAKPEK